MGGRQWGDEAGAGSKDDACSNGGDERGTSEGANGVTRTMRVEPTMTRTTIYDSGGSKSNLGEGEDDGGRSGSRRRAWKGEARAGPPVDTAREVRTRGGDDDRAAAAQWLSGEEDEMMEGKKRGGDI